MRGEGCTYFYNSRVDLEREEGGDPSDHKCKVHKSKDELSKEEGEGPYELLLSVLVDRRLHSVACGSVERVGRDGVAAVH